MSIENHIQTRFEKHLKHLKYLKARLSFPDLRALLDTPKAHYRSGYFDAVEDFGSQEHREFAARSLWGETVSMARDGTLQTTDLAEHRKSLAERFRVSPEILRWDG